jgi:LysM repeat protein
VYLSDGGWLSNAQITAYNADGTVQAQSSYQRSTTIDWERAAILRNERGDPQPNEYDIALDGTGPLVLGSATTYTGYDHADNVTTYSYAGYLPTAFGADYTVHYLKKDGYLEQSTTGTPTVAGYVPATDTSDYDAFGRRMAVSQTSEANSGAAQNVTRIFGYDTSGEIVQRRSGTLSGSTFTATGGYSTDHYTYVNGQQISDLNEAGDISVLGRLTGFSSGASTSSYVVQGGDTLASIAQAVYGNSDYGYIVAEANGLNGDGDLVVGQAISLPSVTTHNNTSTTFKPYNPSEVVGSTTPNLPTVPPPPPSQAGCSGLAQIIVIAITVVVTYFTAGATSELLASELASGAIGGAVGAVAGQVAGDMLGTQNGFNFGQVLVGAVGGAIGGGLSEAFSEGGTLASTFASTTGNGINIAGNAVIGAASYVGAYESEKITGQAAHFSWTGWVANAAGSAAAGELGPTNAQAAAGQQGSNYWERIEANIAQDVTTRETSVALGDHHVQSWKQIGEDVFGNALGNAAIAGMNAYAVNHAQQAAPAITGQITDANGASGFQYNDGVQTFALQDGGTSGADGLPGPFADVGDAPTPTLDDLYAQARALQSRMAEGSITTEQFDQAIGTLNNALTGMQNNAAQGNVGPQGNSYGAGAEGITGRPVRDYDNGVLNIDIYGGTPESAATGSVQGTANTGYGDGNPGWGQALAYHLGNMLTGTLEGAANMVYQPVAQLHDLGAVAYGLYQAAKGQAYQPDYWSATGQGAVTDANSWNHTVENLMASNPVTGSALFGWNLGTAISQRDARSIDMQLGGLAGGLLVGKAGLEGEVPASLATRIESTLNWENASEVVANSARLATGPDQAMFWSGVGRGGDNIAANIASQRGMATLEMTLAERGIKLPPWDPTNPSSVTAWREASYDFAAGANGNVSVIQGDAVRIDSVWAEVEFSALRVNPNVMSITAVDAKTGNEVLLWTRK